MCEYGDTVKVWVTIPANLSHTGKDYRKFASIDRCIAPLVKLLNDGGFSTIACCCGHGKSDGSILLEDK